MTVIKGVCNPLYEWYLTSKVFLPINPARDTTHRNALSSVLMNVSHAVMLLFLLPLSEGLQQLLLCVSRNWLICYLV